MRVDWPYEFPGAYWLDEQEDQAVLDVLHHGSLFRYYGVGEPTYPEGRGKPRHVDRYEAQARRFYGVPHALAVNSGTGALITALRALGIGPGAEVLVPAFLWVASVGAVVQMMMSIPRTSSTLSKLISGNTMCSFRPMA